MNNKKDGLSFLEFSREVADLILISGADNEWLNNKHVRYAWHIFLFFATGFLTVGAVCRVLFSEIMNNSVLFTNLYRLFTIIGFSGILATLTWLGFQFYQNLLMTGRDLRFKSIIFFMWADIAFFALLYRSLYLWNPGIFIYSNPSIIPSVTAMGFSLKQFNLILDFILYSACTSVSLTYPKISSNSPIVSSVNFVQIIIWIALMGLFIATFVQLAAKNKR